MLNDEEIVKAKNIWENQYKSNIYKGIYIDGEMIEFEETLLYDGRLGIMLPKTFIEMPQQMKEIKYPSSDRPQIIKTNLLGSVNFTFSLLEINCGIQQVSDCTNQLKYILEKVMSQYTFSDEYDGSTKNGTYKAFEYYSNALDAKLYTLVFGASIDGKFLLGGFNCKASDKDWWLKSAIQVCESIVDNTRKDETEK